MSLRPFDGSTQIQLARLQDEAFRRNDVTPVTVRSPDIKHNFFVNQQFVVQAEVIAVGVQHRGIERIDDDVLAQLSFDFFTGQYHSGTKTYDRRRPQFELAPTHYVAPVRDSTEIAFGTFRIHQIDVLVANRPKSTPLAENALQQPLFVARLNRRRMKSADFPSFRRRLIHWYSKHARDLPWRRTADPYRIWISEIMLQQTTVVAVIPYFERFLKCFPDVAALAAADEHDVMRIWEGLGYYSRARNIHKAARLIAGQYNGKFPADLATLRSLPGIGRYTAGAIASFAFDLPAPIVEANTLRLYCRLLNYDGDPRSKTGQEILWSFAEAVLPRLNPGRVNQALMELGATICAPRDPDCPSCPVQVHCQALLKGTANQVPLPKTKIPITQVTEFAIAIRDRQRYLLRRRAEKERWAGLWDFVRFEADDALLKSNFAPLIKFVREKTGLQITLGSQVAEIKHAVTRYRITLKCFTACKTGGRLNRDADWKWVKPVEFNGYPLSVTARTLANRLMT